MIKLKVSLTKDGQPVRSFISSSGNRLRVIGAPTFRTRHMLTLAKFGVELIKDRVAEGVGSNDVPMKELSRRKGKRWSKSRQDWVEYGKNSGYAWRKEKAGRPPIRDLTLTGDMLANMSVRSVSETEARIDITKSKERMKARANEIRSPWYGWSPNDTQKLMVKAKELFGQVVDEFRVALLGGQRRSFSSSAIWLNPFEHHHPGSRDAEWASNLADKLRGGK